MYCRNYTRKMSTKPPLKCPKFVPVEGGDISSRSTADSMYFSSTVCVDFLII